MDYRMHGWGVGFSDTPPRDEDRGERGVTARRHRRHYSFAMSVRSLRLVTCLLVIVAVSVVGLTQRPAGASGPHTATISVAGKSYTPKAVNGATDDYHCTLVDPHLKHSAYIVSSQFFPNSVEVHHAILSLVLPQDAARARATDHNGKGWTCFGESALPSGRFGNALANSGWLTVWVPGQGLDPEPAGTGMLVPAGSLLIEQIHYNLLKGDKPVHASVTLHTVPSSAHLQPLTIHIQPAAPDVPCPTGVTGPLCDRSAALADLGKRFGPGAVVETQVIEAICGRNPTDPPVGVSTTCVRPAEPGRKILRITPHMHLTGSSMQVVLNPGTPNAKTLVDDPHYNFDDQRFFNLKTPIVTHEGDTIAVTCTYNPKLRQQLPQLRKQPAKFITWGDGSSDEMCLAIMQSVKAPQAAA